MTGTWTKFRARAPRARAAVTNVRDGESVVSPVNLRFAVDGFGVAPNGFGAEGSGHFVLDVLRNDNSAPQNVDLNNAATQATLLRVLVLVLMLMLVALSQARIMVSDQDRL